MLEIWISHVDAPTQIHPEEPFFIRYQVWYLTGVRHKKFKLFSTLKAGEETIAEFENTINPKFFWGYVSKAIKFSELTKDTTFIISAGFEEIETVFVL